MAEAKISEQKIHTPSTSTRARTHHPLNVKHNHNHRPLLAPRPINCADRLVATLSYTAGGHLSDACMPHRWHEFCDDVDEILAGLVSPAPESFCVLHAAMHRINCQSENGVTDGNELKALESLSFLVKPDFAIDLCRDEDVTKWRLIPREGSIKLPRQRKPLIPEYNADLWRQHSPLQLSQIALELATRKPGDYQTLAEIQDIAQQTEKRLELTLGTDLRGPTSADTCFNFALAGVQEKSGLLESLTRVGIHELKRVGHRASFKPRAILHMVEKFAAADIREGAAELYHIAGVCLEKKGYSDGSVVESLKGGSFGFHCERPRLWLGRFRFKQKKVSLSELPEGRERIIWERFFCDPSKPLVVDIGCGMGGSLLGLSSLSDGDDCNPGVNALQMNWPELNYAGADLNPAYCNFGNGIVSRDTQRKGRVHSFCLSAGEFLSALRSYPGGCQLVMMLFPTPFRLGADNDDGYLPSKDSEQFMVSKNVLALISILLAANPEGKGRFLFQSNCEDVAVHVAEVCQSTMDRIPCKHPVQDAQLQYKKGNVPLRTARWLEATPGSKRAEGAMFSSTPLLPSAGFPEAEVQCNVEGTAVHRCLFQSKR
ncbi:hypothetical protein ACHAXT_004521 [Thalassiosira profunda]